MTKNAAKLDLRNNRITAAAFSLLTSNVTSLIIQLVTVPILLYAWGIEIYGLWVVLFAIPNLIALSDLGLITVTNNQAEILWERREFINAHKAHNSGSIILIGIGFLFAVVVVASLPLLINHISRQSPISGFVPVGLVSAILLLDGWIALLSNHDAAKFRWINRYEKSIQWQAFVRQIPLAVIPMAALVGSNILQVASISLVVRLGVFFALERKLKQTGLKQGFRHGFHSTPEMLRLTRLSISFAVLPISNATYLHVTTLAVASIFSPTVAAAFTTVRTLTRLPTQFLSIIGRSVWSESTKLFASQNKVELQAIFRKVAIQTISLTTASLLLTYLLLPPAYSHWTRNSIEFDPWLFLALLINSHLIAIYTNLEVFILSSNNHARYAVLFLIFSLLQFGVGILLAKQIGVSAFGWAGCVGALATAAMAYVYSKNIINKTAGGNHGIS